MKAEKMDDVKRQYQVHKLIASGWVNYYHYITEDPELGDLDFKHYHLHAVELGEKFPYLKKYMEIV